MTGGLRRFTNKGKMLENIRKLTKTKIFGTLMNKIENL